MKILITGGCGFIGSHLTDFHLAQGHEVCIVDNLSTGSLDNIQAHKNNKNLHFYQDDILSWSDLTERVRWCDRLYHLAAIVGVYRVLSDPENVLKTNILSCERILDAAATNPKANIIIASTSSVYGDTKKAALSESDNLIINPEQFPLNTYAISKIVDESLSQSYSQSKKLKILSIRFFNVIGPRQTGRYGMVVPRFVEQACKNEPITVYGDGKQTRSFCDIRDIINSLEILANLNNDKPNVINLGNDREITINDLALLVRRLAKSSSEILHIPYHEAYGQDYIDIQNRRPDLTRFFQLTHYKHQWSLEQTISDLILLYKKSKL